MQNEGIILSQVLCLYLKPTWRSFTTASGSYRPAINYEKKKAVIPRLLTRNCKIWFYVTVKYGYDGSADYAEYKQKFKNDDGTIMDSHIFATSLVPIRIVANGKVLFENPRPSSTRFCRPVRLQFAKETAALIAAEKSRLDKQIIELKPVILECFGRSMQVSYNMLLTMVDGKVCNAVTSTSSQCCYICGATPSQMNKLNAVLQKIENEGTFQFGLSILHAYIRFFEYFLHMSYRLEIRKWQARTAEHKQLVQEKKDKHSKQIQDRNGSDC